MKIEFENSVFVVPEGWEDIKLSDYEKWYLLNPQTNEELIQFVADVCNINVRELLNAPAKIFNIINESISFLSNRDLPPKDHIEIGNVKYFILPDDKITLGEWVDIDGLMSSESQNKLSELLAIMCRPADEKYDPDKTEQRKELFKQLTCDKVLPLIGFFLLREKRSKAILQHYSAVTHQAKQFLKDTEHFALNGDGIRRLPIWQRIRYIYLIQSLKKQLGKCSDSYYTE